MSSNITSVKFDRVMGNPKNAGSIHLKKSQADTSPIKVTVHNGAGRVKVCAMNKAKYGFEQC